MAIRQVTSRTIKDGEIVDTDLSNSLTVGGGYFQGETNGSSTTGKGHIFRVHEETLNTSVTIASGDNALAVGTNLTVSASGTVNLTVLGNLTIV